MEPIIFPRSTRPAQHKGTPSPASFADASLKAVCAAVYVLREKKDGMYKARLLMSKCCLTSLNGSTTPRAELQALVVLCRLLMVAAVSLDGPVEVVSISTDSEAVIAEVSQKGQYAGQDKVY